MPSCSSTRRITRSESAHGWVRSCCSTCGSSSGPTRRRSWAWCRRPTKRRTRRVASASSLHAPTRCSPSRCCTSWPRGRTAPCSSARSGTREKADGTRRPLFPLPGLLTRRGRRGHAGEDRARPDALCHKPATAHFQRELGGRRGAMRCFGLGLHLGDADDLAPYVQESDRQRNESVLHPHAHRFRLGKDEKHAFVRAEMLP